jgi:hypothetical protein
MTVYMQLNSVILTKGAKSCTFDIKHFYLNTTMSWPEYMQMKISNLPEEFGKLYNLTKIAE